MKSRLIFSCLFLTACCPTATPHRDYLRLEKMEEDTFEIDRTPIPEKPLKYYDIIEIALQQNLELKVKEQEVRIKQEMATSATWKILPSLILNSEQYGRNRNTGSSSQSLTNQPPAPPSISSEQHDLTYNLTYTWNLLDFGLSYGRAKQEANKELMAELEYRRLSQNVVLEVTKSYWKAQLAQKGVEKSEELIRKINEYQDKLRYFATKGTIPAVPTLKMDAQLSKLKLQLQDFHRDFVTAKNQLAQFMGFKDADSFKLVPEEMEMPREFSFKWEELQDTALFNRPELYSRDLEEKIFTEEIRNQALLMAPSVGLYGATNFDSNKFLVYNKWLQAGLKVTYNLFNIPAAYYDMKTAEEQRTLVIKNRVALSLGVLTQLQLAILLYVDAEENWKLAKEYADAQSKLLSDAKVIEKVGEFHDGDLLGFKTDAFLAEMTAFEKYGNLMTSIEAINNALGIPMHYQLRNDL